MVVCSTKSSSGLVTHPSTNHSLSVPNPHPNPYPRCSTTPETSGNTTTRTSTRSTHPSPPNRSLRGPLPTSPTSGCSVGVQLSARTIPPFHPLSSFSELPITNSRPKTNTRTICRVQFLRHLRTRPGSLATRSCELDKEDIKPRDATNAGRLHNIEGRAQLIDGVWDATDCETQGAIPMVWRW